jgi:hypothetical protein
MAGLTSYKPQFDNTYEDIFQKVLVAKEIANGRFMPTLKYGQSVERVSYDISGIRVRAVTRGAASTIDALSDSNETLTINLENEAVFFISDGEVTQAGPLNPGEVIGGQIAIKVAADFDSRIFFEITNAAQTFDNGDLTTTASTGTPISLTPTTVPQMVTRMPAKLRAVNLTLTNTALVVDAYAASDIEQYLLGKQFSIVESVFKNGYAGPIATAEVYVSQNLTGQALLTLSTTYPADGDTFAITGYDGLGGAKTVTFTFIGTLTPTAGQVLTGTSAGTGQAIAATCTNLAAAINAPGTTTATFVALSAANQIVITDSLKLTATATSTTVKVVGKGSGRMNIVKTWATGANGTLTYNLIHCYYGKKGAIDYVLQDISEVDMRITPDRRGTNVFTSYLGGIKTFTDGAKKFLDVWIAA